MPTISVRSDRRLRAAVLACKLADRGLRRRINDATRATIGPVWVQAVTANAHTAMDRKVIAKGVRIKPGNPPVALAATSTRKMRGGMVPAENWPAVEFGVGNRERFTTYRGRSPRGKPYTIKRRTMRGLPARQASGRVAFPAFAETAPRAVSLWVQMIVKIYANALNGDKV